MQIQLLNFLENDLIKAKANRENVPWIVVSMHRPMYCSEKGQDNHSDRMHMEPLFIQYDVDLVLQSFLLLL